MPDRERRWNGWGFVDESFEASPALIGWLEARLGRGDAVGEVGAGEVDLPAPRPLPTLPSAIRTDADARLRHASGMSFPDLVRLRTGAIAAAADGVAAPAEAAEALALVRAASDHGVSLIVRGGGSSVVGGVTVVPSDRPVLVLSLSRMSGLADLDATSQLATFGAGTYGPEVEASLARHGLRLGHEPQSFEHSTIGGWVAARSAGQRSTGVGKIEQLVAGLEVVTPSGLWRLPGQPASAAGPDLRQLVLGSEGRLGVISSVTVRVGPTPPVEEGTTVLLPSWERGVEVARRLLQAGNPVEVLRLSDMAESEMAIAVLELPGAARGLVAWLRERRAFRGGCLLLLGWTGTEFEVTAARRAAAEAWRDAGGFSLGGRGYRAWRRDRFRHPYLRDALLSLGWATDTLETACPWSLIDTLYAGVRKAFHAAAGAAGCRCVVLCHLSHAYRDGASLYFTFLWPVRRALVLDHWNALKRAATDAIVAGGGTISHHHGVGRMHAPWLAGEIGEQGRRLLQAMAQAADPHGTLNPGVLLGGPPC